jgi:hypothetical protein
LGKIYWWEHAEKNTLPSHALNGRTSNNKRNWNALFEEDFKTHFEQLKQESGPITGVVRELTGLETIMLWSFLFGKRMKS